MNKIYLAALGLLMMGNMVFAQETPENEFKPTGKVFGHVFGDYYYKAGSSQVDSLLVGRGEYSKMAMEDNAFALRRFYLGYKYDFSKKFSANLMFEGSDGNLIQGDKRGVNIKYFYLRWHNIFPNADLTVGGQNTPTWSRFTEKVWGYRSVEKTIVDFRGDGISSDVGVSLSGKFTKDGTIGYELMVGNGTAQRLENNKNKKIYSSVNASLFDKQLLLEVYFDTEKDQPGNAVSVIKGFAGYSNDLLTIGAEPYQKFYTIGSAKTSAFGTTFFVTGRVIKDKLNALARFDIYNRDVDDIDLTGISNAYTENFILFGIDYTPIKNINIIPNVWINTYNRKDNVIFPEKESDIVARITASWKF